MRVDLSDLPDDPLERLAHLGEVEEQIRVEIHRAYANAYFDARLTGQIDDAISVRRHGRRRILSMTRWLNRERGSSVRWGDRLDRTSTAYSPD
jgi:hypothetical protein